MYNTYLTLKGITPISYMAYLDDFDRFVRIPPDTKATPAYKTYASPLPALNPSESDPIEPRPMHPTPLPWPVMHCPWPLCAR